MSCDWEGNRRSGVAVAMRHRLQWFIHLRAQGLRKSHEHPVNTPHGVRYSLPLSWSAAPPRFSPSTCLGNGRLKASGTVSYWPDVLHVTRSTAASSHSRKLRSPIKTRTIIHWPHPFFILSEGEGGAACMPALRRQ